ncbi:MAG: hypothetical protein IKX44_11475 [Prevotella sp.]|nr:hypothetical protein [Prevotella sp.]
MKKLVYILGSLFLLSAGFAACSCESEDPPEQPNSHQDETPVDSTLINNHSSKVDSTGSYTVISTVEVSEEVKAFFDEALPNENRTPAFSFSSENETEFIVINSQGELESRYKGEKSLPEIDFAKYTLIIGKAYMLGMTYHVESLEIHKYEYDQTLCVFTDNPSGLFWMAYNMHFWGLFPHNNMMISNIIVITKEEVS